MGMYIQKTITVLLVVHVFDSMTDTYMPRLDMPRELPLQIHNARKALQLIESGKQLIICNALFSKRNFSCKDSSALVLQPYMSVKLVYMNHSMHQKIDFSAQE